MILGRRSCACVLWLWLLAACSFDARFDADLQPSAGDAGLQEPADDDPREQPDAGAEPSAAVPVFRDDFERDDGPLAPPWRDTGLGVPSLWRGQACLDRGQGVTLDLTPARYGYLRVDVTGGDDLSLSLQDAQGALLRLDWRIRRDYTRMLEASSGEDVGAYTSARVRTLEIEIDQRTHHLRARQAGGPWQELEPQATLPFELARLRFERAQVEPRPKDVWVCLDNVYVGPAQPSEDPFAHSPHARAGRPTDNEQEFCLYERCGELAGQCLEQENWAAVIDAFPDLECENCPLQGGMHRLVADMPLDPSGAPLQFLQNAPSRSPQLVRDLARCAVDRCALDVTATPVALTTEFQIGTAPLRQPPFALYALLAGSDRVLAASVFSSQIYLSDGETGIPLASASDQLRMYTDTAEEVSFVLATHGDDAPRVYVASGYQEWTELRFGMPVVSLALPHSQRSMWVETARVRDAQVRTRQIVSPTSFWDSWYTRYRVTEPLAALAQLTSQSQHVESHDYWIAQRTTGPTVLSSAGFERALHNGVDGDFRVIASFEDSVVFEHPTSGERRWLTLDDKVVPSAFPEGQMRGTYLVSATDVWATGGRELVHVAAFPSALDWTHDRPVASDAQAVLYQTPVDVRLYDVSGHELAVHAPAAIDDGQGTPLAVAPRRVVPWGTQCGLFLSGHDGETAKRTAIDVYVVDEAGVFTVERQGVLERGPDEVRIASHPEGMFAWYEGTRVQTYDCRTHAGQTLEAGKRVLALSEYPTVPAHFTPEPLPPPEDEF